MSDEYYQRARAASAVMNAYHSNITGPDMPGHASKSWVHQLLQHQLALQSTNAHVIALRKMLTGLGEYADAHRALHDSPIGTDGVLGESWAAIAQALLELLNGETGGLDCGTVDHTIREMAKAAQVDLDE